MTQDQIDEDRYMTQGIALVRAMMRSTSRQHIRAIDYWSRAKSALEVAARSATSFSSLVSKMGHKLQIDATRKDTGVQVDAVRMVVAPDFEAFRRYLASEALYVIAIAQAESKVRAEEWAREEESMAEDLAALQTITQTIIDTVPVKE